MIGLNLNFAFNQNIGLNTGLEFDFESFKYSFVATNPIYYTYADTKIFRNQEDGEAQNGSSVYRITERKQKATYLTIPTMLLFRTNAIGDFKYYGKFGARTSFVLGYTMNDNGFQLVNDAANPGVPKEVALKNTDMKTTKDMNFFRSSVGIAGGAEWNFTGNTNLFAEVGFYYGFTNVHAGKALTGDDDKNMTLYQYDKTTAPPTQDFLTLGATQKQIVLKIGILF